MPFLLSLAEHDVQCRTGERIALAPRVCVCVRARARVCVFCGGVGIDERDGPTSSTAAAEVLWCRRRAAVSRRLASRAASSPRDAFTAGLRARDSGRLTGPTCHTAVTQTAGATEPSFYFISLAF